MIKVDVVNSSDIPQIIGLYKKSATEAYSPIFNQQKLEKVTSTWFSHENLINELNKTGSIFIGAKSNEHFVGAIQAEMKDKNTIHIIRLYILPRFQRKGIGTLLMNQALVKFPKGEKIYLEAIEKNKKAIDFYLSKGFKITKRKIAIVAEQSLQKVEMEKKL